MSDFIKSESRKNMERKEKIMDREYKKINSIHFPNCIGTYPECKNYHKDMKKEERTECRLCPHRESDWGVK